MSTSGSTFCYLLTEYKNIWKRLLEAMWMSLLCTQGNALSKDFGA